MSTSQQVPDYELDEVRTATSTHELEVMFDPFRSTLLQLLLTRAGSILETRWRSASTKATVAYHVRVLTDAGLLKVVRTRSIRGQQERFYGRTARLFGVGQITSDQAALTPNTMAEWAAETMPAHQADELRVIRRYAWISYDDADASGTESAIWSMNSPNYLAETSAGPMRSLLPSTRRRSGDHPRP